MYTPENVYHISLYNDNYVMYSILTESHDQGLLNKPSYMFLPSLVLEILPEHSKHSKHLTGFLRHCNKIRDWEQWKYETRIYGLPLSQVKLLITQHYPHAILVWEVALRCRRGLSHPGCSDMCTWPYSICRGWVLSLPPQMMSTT